MLTYFQQCVVKKEHRHEIVRKDLKEPMQTAICCGEPVKLITRKDHAYEAGAYSTCFRCGDEQGDHDR
jgi:hypothetical protein